MLVCIFFVFGALVGYAYLLWKKKKSCLKRKKNRKQTEEEGKLRAIRKEDYRYVMGVPIKIKISTDPTSGLRWTTCSSWCSRSCSWCST